MVTRWTPDPFADHRAHGAAPVDGTAPPRQADRGVAADPQGRGASPVGGGPSRPTPVLVGDSRKQVYADLRKALEQPVLDLVRETRDKLPPHEVNERIRARIGSAVAEFNHEANRRNRLQLPAEAANELFYILQGFGRLQQFYDNRIGATDVMCDGPGKPLYYEKAGVLHDTDIVFSEQEIRDTAEALQPPGGLPLGPSNPKVEVNLEHARLIFLDSAYTPRNGPCFAMRLRALNPYRGEDMVGDGVLPRALMLFLARAQQAGASVIVAGPTGSYKTTLVQAMLDLISTDERIITIEEGIELSLQRDHLIQMEVNRARGLTARAALFDALRLNPAYLLLGEVRAAEAFDLLNAINANKGQFGTSCTVHATSAQDTLRRLATLCTFADERPRLDDLWPSLERAIDLIVVLRKFRYTEDGEPKVARRVVEVSEVTGLKAGGCETTPLLVWEGGPPVREDGSAGGGLRATGLGISPDLATTFETAGIRVPDYEYGLPRTRREEERLASVAGRDGRDGRGRR